MFAGGPWFDSAWERLSYLHQARDKARAGKAPSKGENASERVLWDIGILLAVPLIGAAFVGVILNLLQIN